MGDGGLRRAHAARSRGARVLRLLRADAFVVAGLLRHGRESRSPEQCDSGASAAFVTHGLWPNDANGRDPCGDKMQQDYVPSAALSVGERVYPTRGLAIHEWRTHGVCTGLDAEHYFRAVQFARDEFTIPETLRHPTARFDTTPAAIFKAFADVNANLTAGSIGGDVPARRVDRRALLLTRDLRAFAICPDVARRSCRSGSLKVSPPR